MDQKTAILDAIQSGIRDDIKNTITVYPRNLLVFGCSFAGEPPLKVIFRVTTEVNFDATHQFQLTYNPLQEVGITF